MFINYASRQLAYIFVVILEQPFSESENHQSFWHHKVELYNMVNLSPINHKFLATPLIHSKTFTTSAPYLHAVFHFYIRILYSYKSWQKFKAGLLVTIIIEAFISCKNEHKSSKELGLLSRKTQMVCCNLCYVTFSGNLFQSNPLVSSWQNYSTEPFVAPKGRNKASEKPSPSLILSLPFIRQE